MSIVNSDELREDESRVLRPRLSVFNGPIGLDLVEMIA